MASKRGLAIGASQEVDGPISIPDGSVLPGHEGSLAGVIRGLLSVGAEPKEVFLAHKRRTELADYVRSVHEAVDGRLTPFCDHLSKVCESLDRPARAKLANLLLDEFHIHPISMPLHSSTYQRAQTLAADMGCDPWMIEAIAGQGRLELDFGKVPIEGATLRFPIISAGSMIKMSGSAKNMTLEFEGLNVDNTLWVNGLPGLRVEGPVTAKRLWIHLSDGCKFDSVVDLEELSTDWSSDIEVRGIRCVDRFSVILEDECFQDNSASEEKGLRPGVRFPDLEEIKGEIKARSAPEGGYPSIHAPKLCRVNGQAVAPLLDPNVGGQG